MNSKIVTGLALIAGLIIAIIMAVQVGQGEFKTVYVTTVLLFSIPIMMMLGLRSWYILPFAMLAELPALPLIGGKSLSLAEMGIAMFAGLMALAVIQGRKRFQIKIGDWWPLLLYGGWVLMIAVINGGGFAILGSSSMGSRRYLTVLIALVAMVCLSQMTIRDKEAKRVCWLIFFSMAATGLYLAGGAYMGRIGLQNTYEFYSWQQGLSNISLGGIFLMFARYAPSEVLKKPLCMAVFFFLLVIAVYSGKRMNFAACCVIPVIASLWHRQAIFSLLATMLAILTLSGAVVIQNGMTSIPQSLQRVLAFIPAEWDYEVEQSTNNIFRDTLNNWAWKAVEERPLIGKGVAMTADDFLLMSNPDYVREVKDPDDDVQAFPHIAGNNWHSTWLGLSASFGIPCGIIWIIVQICVLRRSWKLGHTWGLSVWQSTLMGMIFFFMVYGVMRSVSSGDVAMLAMGGGLYLGLISAVKNGVRDERLEKSQKAEIQTAKIRA